MGQGHVSARRHALIAAVALGVQCATLPAQGIVYRESWSHLHLEQRRLEVLHELRSRPAEDADAVARLFAAPDRGEPWRRIAEVMAMLRGVAADDAFVLRAAMCAFVLPEVADPDGANTECRVTNVSAFLPTSLPLPPALAIEVVVHDSRGEQVWSGQIVGEPTLENLRMARTVTRIPSDRLPDGSYFATVRTCIGGKQPGPGDPTLRWPLHVLRGFQARCEAAMARAAEVGPAQEPLSRALVAGLARPLHRTYHGEAFEGTSRALADLHRLEHALQNLDDQRHVLDGMAGDVPVQLVDGGLRCIVRLPEPFASERAARPLVVFAAASPAWDAGITRPAAPATRGPGWLAEELPVFGARAGCDVMFVESPGGGRDHAPALAAAIEGGKRLLGTGGKPVLLVCDRESASVAALHVERLRSVISGLVLVGSGGMSGAVLDGLGSFPVRMVPVNGHTGSDGLRRSLDYVKARAGAGEWRGDVARLVEAEPTWVFAVPLLADAIEAFAIGQFAR